MNYLKVCALIIAVSPAVGMLRPYCGHGMPQVIAKKMLLPSGLHLNIRTAYSNKSFACDAAECVRYNGFGRTINPCQEPLKCTKRLIEALDDLKRLRTTIWKRNDMGGKYSSGKKLGMGDQEVIEEILELAGCPKNKCFINTIAHNEKFLEDPQLGADIYKQAIAQKEVLEKKLEDKLRDFSPGCNGCTVDGWEFKQCKTREECLGRRWTALDITQGKSEVNGDPLQVAGCYENQERIKAVLASSAGMLRSLRLEITNESKKIDEEKKLLSDDLRD